MIVFVSSLGTFPSFGKVKPLVVGNRTKGTKAQQYQFRNHDRWAMTIDQFIKGLAAGWHIGRNATRHSPLLQLPDRHHAIRARRYRERNSGEQQ